MREVEEVEKGLMQAAQRFFVLTNTDNLWKEHLQAGLLQCKTDIKPAHRSVPESVVSCMHCVIAEKLFCVAATP